MAILLESKRVLLKQDAFFYGHLNQRGWLKRNGTECRCVN